jgi:two-component system phosphate regulon sensor histidine kinase PhoR
VRLAYPLSEVEATSRQMRRSLLWGTALAFALALILSTLAARYTCRRLRRILTFAESVSAGDLTARIASTSTDEVGQVTAALDKTARRLEDNFAAVQQSQRQLETLLNSMQDAVIAVDAEGRVQWANQGMLHLTQRVRLQAPLVETVRDPELLRAVQEAVDTRTVRGGRAIAIVSGKTFDVTAAPLPDGGAVAVLRDLTERELLEKTRRDFIANVSHELRTPLTNIQGYSETLLDNASPDSPQREFLEIIRKNAARMGRLTEDLLALARVESGEKRFELEPVTPEDLLRDAAQNFAETAGRRDLQLEVKDEAARPVLADRDAIHHVFGNLLENALKYGGSGTRIVLGARPVEDAVEFYVQDFGPGIPSEHLSRLFERFVRALRRAEAGARELERLENLAFHEIFPGRASRLFSHRARKPTMLFRMLSRRPTFSGNCFLLADQAEADRD